MAKEKKTYSNTQEGTPLITTISTGCKTPLLDVRFCNLIKPYYYPNSPTIPRYSITCILDPVEQKDFLNGIQTIEKNEGVDSIIKSDHVKKDGEYVNTGKALIKFQTKDLIPVYVKNEKGEDELIDMQDELAKGEKVIVVYDILRYTKKNTFKAEHGLSFKPSCVYYYPQEGK